jgi:predicted TIM-barrel fold metal-dependent hydrolase
MFSFPVYSAEMHVIEPADLWQEYIDPRFRDRAPRQVREERTDQWYADKDAKFGTMGVAYQAGRRFEDPKGITYGGRVEEVPRGAYDPHAHLADMETDGVRGSVVFPAQSLTLYDFPDPELRSACCLALNEWVAEFARPYPKRLKAMGIVNPEQAEETAHEIRRAAEQGLAGGLIPLESDAPRYDDPAAYEPVWAAAKETGFILCLHTADFAGTRRVRHDISINVNREVRMRNALGSLLFGRVFERYPALRVGVVEFEASWLPYFAFRADQVFTRPGASTVSPFKDGTLPSEILRRNVFVTFTEDPLAATLRREIGVENLLWGSDYPHAESSFPRSRETLERILAGLPEAEQALIAGGNAARIFGLD